MSQGITNLGQSPEALDGIYSLIREELGEVERVLRREIRSRHPYVNRLVDHGFHVGGKRLRPALVLLSGKACGRTGPEHPLLGAAVEIIHTATLIHDDVLDEATLRRHVETVNVRFDNEASVLLGDYLFTRSMCLASSLDDAFACRAIGEAGQAICEGELRQIESRGNYDITEEAYLDIIADKTGALCACSCRLGAYYAGADRATCDAHARFGRTLGIAFQIVDDLLDLVGEETTMGKSLGTDLVKQKPTLPLIRLLSQTNGADRTRLIEALSRPGNHHRDVLKPWLERSDAVAYAKEKAIRYIRRAIEELPGTPQTEASESLRKLAGFVVARRV